MLNGDSLGQEILTAIDGMTDEDKTDREKIFKTMGNAIVDHIQANGEVNQIPSIVNDSLSSTVIVPNDGGANLKTTFATALSSNAQTGSIS